jgi:hypothetical protein
MKSSTYINSLCRRPRRFGLRRWSTRPIGRGVEGKVGKEAKHHIDDALRIRSRPENLALVVLQRLQPIRNIAGVLRDVGRDAKLGRYEGAGEFRAQLLHSVGFRTEARFHAFVSVQSSLVAGPVAVMPTSGLCRVDVADADGHWLPRLAYRHNPKT